MHWRDEMRELLTLVLAMLLVSGANIADATEEPGEALSSPASSKPPPKPTGEAAPSHESPGGAEILCKDMGEAAVAGAASRGVVPEEGSVAWWHVLLSHLLEIFGSLLAVTLQVFVVFLLKKTGMQITVEREAMINDVVRDGVMALEEIGRRALMTGRKMEGAEKADECMKYIMGKLQASGLKKLAMDEIRKRMEAALMRERQNGGLKTDAVANSAYEEARRRGVQDADS